MSTTDQNTTTHTYHHTMISNLDNLDYNTALTPLEASHAGRMKETLQLTTTANVSFQRVADLLCCAIEGGSSYWAEIKSVKKPENAKTDIVDYPFNGGSITFADSEGDMPDATLDLEAIKQGLQVMATEHPRHWQDFLNENEDAGTGDTFLQCCLYGDVVFA